MSPQPASDGPDRRVVPLRAVNAETETRLDQSTGAAYTGVEDDKARRRPIFPDHWRTVEAAKTHYRLLAARHGHAAAYHGVRAPKYLTMTILWSLVGVFRTSGRVLHWWHVPEMHILESQAAADGLVGEHLRLHKAGKDTRKARGLIIAICGVLAIVGLVLMTRAPGLAWVALAVAAVALLARAGRPANRRIITPAVVPVGVQPPTQDVITRALAACGIAGIDRWLRDGKPLQFPSPVREDGPGWKAEVDLPYGVTAAMVIDRREQLASGLRRPLGAVWPEPMADEHSGRLEVWVGRADAAKARQGPWPLAKGAANIFDGLPFGTDVRGRMIRVPIVYHNWLIGSIPRQGKTASVRELCCGVALDPYTEQWIHELKGSGDLDPLEKVCHRYCSGVDDASIAYAAESLRKLRAEVSKRTERLKALGRDICPDKRVTRDIAVKRSLKLWSIVCTIDEAQNLFAHPEYGKQAGQDAEFIIKIGPAFGVILIIATQRPDKTSLPTGVSGNVSLRFCLKVMGQIENDMILGTSAYKNGIRATTFRPEIDAGIGYLVGATSAPQVVRTYYLDMAACERVAVRARAARDRAGTLTGCALGADADEARDVLADLLSVIGDAPGIHWDEAAAQLATRFPDRWADASPDAVSAEARARSVESVTVNVGGKRARGCRQDTVAAAAGR